jgi:hypothetical protein
MALQSIRPALLQELQALLDFFLTLRHLPLKLLALPPRSTALLLQATQALLKKLFLSLPFRGTSHLQLLLLSLQYLQPVFKLPLPFN